MKNIYENYTIEELIKESNNIEIKEDKRKAQKTILNQKTPSGKFVATYAILTSDNPNEKVMTDEELHKYYENPMKYNNEKRAELKRLLRDGVINSIEKDGSNVEYHIPYVKIRGKYGETKIRDNQGKEVILPSEHSFLLLNVQVGEAEGIAKRFKQQSFIYGINHDDGTREVYTYTMKYSSKTKEITDYTKQGELIEPNADPSNQNAEDYYSISKGYKWSFDFVDDAWDDTDVDLNEIWDVKNIDSMKESLKENSAFRRFNKRKAAYRLSPSNLDENNRIIEDTKKLKNGKWANVGKDGKVDSGTFKTKKQADAQRKAMFAQGYHEDIDKVTNKVYNFTTKGESMNEKKYIKQCEKLLEKYSNVNISGYKTGLGNAYSSRRYVYTGLDVANDKNPILVEKIDYEVPQDMLGGIVVISTDVNASEQNKNKLLNWISQKIKTFKNRITYSKKTNDRLKGDEKVGGWTIGRFLRGRYVGKNGQVFDENSFSIEIVGVDFKTLLDIAEDLCKSFDQETVLVKTYNPQRVLFVNSEKEINDKENNKK